MKPGRLRVRELQKRCGSKKSLCPEKRFTCVRTIAVDCAEVGTQSTTLRVSPTNARVVLGARGKLFRFVRHPGARAYTFPTITRTDRIRIETIISSTVVQRRRFYTMVFTAIMHARTHARKRTVEN
jgi:hypothetical protein